jgi:hypothetical protein
MAIAAGVGVTLTLITDPSGSVDSDLSVRTREAVLAATTVQPGGGTPESSLPGLAISLGAALSQDGAHVLSPGEQALLREWLQRLES